MPHGFVHSVTGAGVTLDGRVVAPVIDARRRRPQLVDYLNTARGAGVDRLWLTGPRPGRVRRTGDLSEWLTLPAPGWAPSDAGHYFDADRPAGRFVHVESGAKVVVRRAWQWFGDTVTNPADVAAAWRLVEREMAHPNVFGPGAHLWDSPSATGQNALMRTWHHLAAIAARKTLPREWPEPAQLDDQLAAFIRSTSTQHRVAPLSPPGDLGDTLPGFVYLDARFAFAAHLRELGMAPAEQLHGVAAHTFADANQYARARYRVRFAAPDGWSHVGVLLAKSGAHDWHAPLAGETWCDAAELFVARRWGWHVQVLDAIVFAKGRPLDAWGDAILRLRDRVENADDVAPVVRDAASSAARAILLQTIGAFHGSSVERRHYVANAIDAPRGSRLVPYGTGFVYTTRVDLRGVASALAHPEWSAQIWGRARAAILDGAQGKDATGAKVRAGALHVPAEHVVGIHGDALYLTHDPDWPNGDAVGQLRRKGAIRRAVKAPRTGQDVYALARAAERAEQRRKVRAK